MKNLAIIFFVIFFSCGSEVNRQSVDPLSESDADNLVSYADLNFADAQASVEASETVSSSEVGEDISSEAEVESPESSDEVLEEVEAVEIKEVIEVVDTDEDGDPDDTDCEPKNSDISHFAVEQCNELDDDCDGEIDENFNLKSDQHNCGKCGSSCSHIFPNAAAYCWSSKCHMLGCMANYADLNGEEKDGCECHQPSGEGCVCLETAPNAISLWVYNKEKFVGSCELVCTGGFTDVNQNMVDGCECDPQTGEGCACLAPYPNTVGFWEGIDIGCGWSCDYPYLDNNEDIVDGCECEFYTGEGCECPAPYPNTVGFWGGPDTGMCGWSCADPYIDYNEDLSDGCECDSQTGEGCDCPDSTYPNTFSFWYDGECQFDCLPHTHDCNQDMADGCEFLNWGQGTYYCFEENGCAKDSDCEDGDYCTANYCLDGQCAYLPYFNGCCNTAADCQKFLANENPCVSSYSCLTIHECVPNFVAGCCSNNFDCEDDNQCTLDYCNPESNNCEYSAEYDGMSCDEGLGECDNGECLLVLNSGDLIKGSLSTIYYLGADGHRYVFPVTAVYQSWYGDDYITVKTLTDAELVAIPMGGNVTVRPGNLAQIVNMETPWAVVDSKVYAVEKGAILRWVTSTEVAVEIWGEDWETQIYPVQESFLSDYIEGSDIVLASDYDLASQQAIATINQDLGLSSE